MADDQYQRTALENEVEAIGLTPVGQRNDQLNVSSFNLGQLVGAGLLDEATVQRRLYDAGIAAGLTSRETIATITSGMTKGKLSPRQPRPKPPAGQSAPSANGFKSEIPPEAISKWTEWPVYWSDEPQDIDWLCEPLIAAGQAVSLYSPAKVGKSLLMLEIAAGLACGRPVMGNSVVDPFPVAYIDHESSEYDLRDRLEDMGYSGAVDMSRFYYSLLGDWKPLDTEAGGVELLSEVTKIGARLVVIDTISRTFLGEENDADTFNALYRYTVLPLKRAGVAFLRLDHSGKDIGRGQRGTSAKTTDVDVVWRLLTRDGDPDTLTLTRDMSRSGYGPAEILLRRVQNPLRHVPEVTDVANLNAVERAVLLLEKHGVPLDWGRDKAARTLRENGEQVRNSTLSQALKVRRDRLAPTDLGLSQGTEQDETGSGTASGTDSRLFRDSPRRSGVLSPVPPSLEGDRGQPTPKDKNQVCVICGERLDPILLLNGYDRHLGCGAGQIGVD